MNRNLILNTDSYKASHYLQYPPGTRHVTSYIEARGPAGASVLFFGLQGFIKEYLQRPIRLLDITQASEFFKTHGLPFNDEGWKQIWHDYDGLLPLSIEAAPEGTVIPTGNVMVQIRNTDPRMPWLTSYIETALLRAIWYPSTVATRSWRIKNLIAHGLKNSGDEAGLPFKLHDFGARGVSSQESAAIGGAAHLVNFQGSDTVAGILWAREHYGEEMAGFSIPAAEHSTITAWRKARETDAYANMIDQFGNGIFAVVSDSYNLDYAVGEIWGRQLKDRVQKIGGCLVIRPDSGDPVYTPIATIERLMELFGCEVNAKGYRVLPKYLRVIQGDGLKEDTIEAIIEEMIHQRISVDNIAFGMGGQLLQGLNRDTFKFAMKACEIETDTETYPIFKAPVDDPSKASKAGRQQLWRRPEDGLFLTGTNSWAGYREPMLREVYRNGSLLVDDTFADIRARANAAFATK